MTYQVLARKWRPRSFDALRGQEHVVEALTHALNSGRLHHAYLFTGTRGVGKTTLARILAKSFNCEAGVTAKPCGICSACTEIDAGRFVDLIEVDAATNTKAEEMRQLLENAVYAPTRGRYKVYVIDEVHMLSGHAFNAMLKTLEEPPDHVKFILATTDPQKIPVTVLSRCLQFNLKQMTPPLIATHLKDILEAESISAEPAALRLLARSAAGSMRDALSLLDQAIAHGAGKVEEARVRDMLGTVDLDYLFSILDALLAGDVAGMLRVAESMAARSLSFSAALQEFASLMTRLHVAQFAPQAVADDLPERARLLDLAKRLDPEYVQLAYQIAVAG
ncbi:MAG: DNA polymerase III subunit gamma/tau, partial [Candidatus Accumulibacter sp.]|nr:DNA polymerase III subunit gamma/tau [Accumulibacter sp.]